MHCIAILAYAARPEAVRWASHAAIRLREEGVEVILDTVLASVLSEEIVSRCDVRPVTEFDTRADMVMTFGGDGTLLATTRVLMGSDVEG